MSEKQSFSKSPYLIIKENEPIDDSKTDTSDSSIDGPIKKDYVMINDTTNNPFKVVTEQEVVPDNTTIKMKRSLDINKFKVTNSFDSKTVMDRQKEEDEELFNFTFERTDTMGYPPFVTKAYYFKKGGTHELVQASKFANMYFNYAFREQSSVAFSYIGDQECKGYFLNGNERDDKSFIDYFSNKGNCYSLDYLAIFTTEEIMVRYKSLLARETILISNDAHAKPLTTYRYKNFKDIIPVCQIPIKFDPRMDIKKEYLNGEKVLFGDICHHESLCHETFCVEHHYKQWSNIPTIGDLYYIHPVGVPLREPRRISTSTLLSYL